MTSSFQDKVELIRPHAFLSAQHRSQLKGGFISNGFILARQSNGRKYTMILSPRTAAGWFGTFLVYLFDAVQVYVLMCCWSWSNV